MESFKNICIVDDHPVVRKGLSELLPKIGAYRVVSEFEDGKEFMDQLRAEQLPDMVLLDLSMPRMSGLEVLKELHATNSRVPVLILSLNSDENQIVQCFRFGARGYLDKNAKAEQIRQALEDIFRSGYHHNEFRELSLTGGRKPSSSHTILENISPREKEFFKLICDEKEYTYEQIADLMNVSLRTVEGFRQSLFDKFAIRSKTGLVLFVLKHKLYDYL